MNVGEETTPGSLSLLVGIPALNEQRTIAQVIAAIPSEIPGVSRVRVVVVDDGSTDGTASAARATGAEVLSHGRNRGLSRAFATLLAYARGSDADILVTLDADGQFDAGDIVLLIEPITSGRAAFATASRFKDPQLVPKMPAMKLWGNRRISQLVSRLTGLKLYDVSCGMRAYTREAFCRLNLMGDYTYTHEVILTLAFGGFTIEEVPIKVRGEREFGQSRIAFDLKRYAIETARIIAMCYRDHRPLAFFGAIAMVLCGIGSLMGLGLLAHYLWTGQFTPYKWIGFTGAALFAFGAQSFLLGMVGDMLRRHRVYLEDILYETRQRAHADGGAGRNQDTPVVGELR